MRSTGSHSNGSRQAEAVAAIGSVATAAEAAATAGNGCSSSGRVAATCSSGRQGRTGRDVGSSCAAQRGANEDPTPQIAFVVDEEEKTHREEEAVAREFWCLWAAVREPERPA